MSADDFQADLEAVRRECEAAATAVLAAAESVMAQADGLDAREPEAAARLREAGLKALQACEFQDLVGQLLTRLADGRSDDPLLQGPAATGEGLEQDDIDALMAAA